MKGLAWLIGVMWLFGVAVLVLMELTTAAGVMLVGLALYSIFVYFMFNAPPEAFGHQRRRKVKANRNAGRTYRVQAVTTRKTLHERR